jgi:hypothetical protein
MPSSRKRPVEIAEASAPSSKRVRITIPLIESSIDESLDNQDHQSDEETAMAYIRSTPRTATRLTPNSSQIAGIQGCARCIKMGLDCQVRWFVPEWATSRRHFSISACTDCSNAKAACSFSNLPGRFSLQNLHNESKTDFFIRLTSKAFSFLDFHVLTICRDQRKIREEGCHYTSSSTKTGNCRDSTYACQEIRSRLFV